MADTRSVRTAGSRSIRSTHEGRFARSFRVANEHTPPSMVVVGKVVIPGAHHAALCDLLCRVARRIEDRCPLGTWGR